MLSHFSCVWLFGTPWTVCSPPGSSVHGILKARILEWIAIHFSRGSSWPRDQTWVSYISKFFTIWAYQGSPVSGTKSSLPSKAAKGFYWSHSFLLLHITIRWHLFVLFPSVIPIPSIAHKTPKLGQIHANLNTSFSCIHDVPATGLLQADPQTLRLDLGLKVFFTPSIWMVQFLCFL